MSNISIFQNNIVREPLFSLNEYNNIPKDPEYLNSFIDFLFEDIKFRESIYLSSPSLYFEWKKVIAKKSDRDKINHTILKFYLRAISNTVPFGLFTSYSVFKEETEEPGYERFSNIDMSYILNLIDFLNKHALIRNCVKFRKNNSIYKISDTYRYIEPNYTETKIDYILSSIDSNELIDFLMSQEQKEVTFNELIVLIDDAVEGVTEEDIKAYIIELIDSKIYLSSLEVCLNEVNLIEQVIDFYYQNKEKIKTDSDLNQIFEHLIVVNQKINVINQNIFNDITSYESIFEELNKINIPYKKAYVTNSNLKKTFPEEYNIQEINRKLNTMIKVLSKISNKKTEQSINLIEFKKRFYERYEEREVSLIKALDNELGIGYLEHLNGDVIFSDLIDDITPASIPEEIIQKSVNPKIYNFWINLIMGNSNKKEIDLKNIDFKIFGKNKKIKNGTFPVSYTYANDKIYLKQIGGSSGTSLIGRFSNNDMDIQQNIDDITAYEKSIFQDQIVAEIIHVPDSRGGNILIRKVNRDAEISILSKSSEASNVLNINDLKISLRNNHLIIKDGVSGKQVVPFLSSAQNFHYNSLPVYQFLCDLQTQNSYNNYFINYGGFDIDDLEYCPRITYGNDIILRKSTWLLKNGNFKNKDTFKQQLKELGVPDFVYIVNFDEEKLIIDLNNKNTLEILFQELSKNRQLQIRECIYDMNKNIFANEFISIIKAEKKKESYSQINIETNDRKIKRSFIYGDEWLSFKIYTGRKTADKILIENISSIVEKLKRKDLIDKWFFIRFTDPHFHLRLRFLLKSKDDYTEVTNIINDVFSKLLEVNKIWKLELFTYNRELERYHWDNIENAESIFHADSDFTISILNYINTNKEKDRWMYLLKSVDDLFNAFDIDLKNKHKILNDMFMSFWMEHGKIKAIKKDVFSKFRKYETEITESMDTTLFPENLDNIYQDRFHKIRELNDAKFDKGRLESLLWSYIHMHINRFFETNPRFHELVLYGLLERHYNKEIGIRKYNKTENWI